MNKIIWAIVILAVLIAGGIYLMGDSDAGDEQNSLDEGEEIPEENLANLESDEDVFNEIDSSLEVLE